MTAFTSFSYDLQLQRYFCKKTWILKTCITLVRKVMNKTVTFVTKNSTDSSSFLFRSNGTAEM